MKKIILIHQLVAPKFALAGIIVASAALIGGAAATLRPAPTGSMPAAEFSTARALEHVRLLAQKPRPLASAANAEARQYILDQLRALGLQPEVQTATAQKTTVDRYRNAHIALGVVNNIVVRVPGKAPANGSSRTSAPRPAVLLAAGYDTGERSVGAASAAPVAALLETLRVLQGGAPLSNDLIVLFADGEQAGGLGSRAFAGQHPLAKRAGVVMRFDSAGSQGPLVLIGASGDVRTAVGGWASATPDPHGSSFMQSVYAAKPGAPEMGALGSVGSARLHFANVEGSNGAGVGSRDTPGRLDPASVRSMGDTMLALARHFGEAEPVTAPGAEAVTAADAGAVYFTLPGIGALAYPAGAVWMLTRLACLMFLIVCWMAIYRGDVEPGDIANGALGFIFIAAIMALAAGLVWHVFPSLHRGYDAFAYGAGAHDRWFLAGFAALGTCLFIILQRGFRRVAGRAAVSLGPLLVAVILLLLASWYAPGTSYALAWPLMGTLLAYGTLYAPFAKKLAGYQRALVLFAGAAPAALLIAPLMRDMFVASSPERMNLPMAALAVLLGLCTVLLTAQRRFMVRGAAAVGAACFAVAGSAAPYGTEPIPQPNRLVYLKDAYTWKSYWMMAAGPLDDWSRKFFPNAKRPEVQVDTFGYGSPKMWLAHAPRSELAFPALFVLRDDVGEGGRKVEFTLDAKPLAPVVDITLAGAGTLHSSVNGRALTDQSTTGYTISLYGMGGQHLHFRFDLNSDETTRVFVHERIPGLPPNDIGARPDGVAPPMTPMTESTILSDTLLFR